MNLFAAMRAKYDAAHPKEAPVLTKDTDPTGVPHWSGTAPVTQEYSRAAEKVVNTAPQTVGKETHDASVGVLENSGASMDASKPATAWHPVIPISSVFTPSATSAGTTTSIPYILIPPATPVAQPVKEPVMATAPVTPAPPASKPCCRFATQTAASLFNVAETAAVSFMTVEGVLNTPQGQAAVTAMNDAKADLQNWKTGSDATEALELVEDVQTALQVLPIPAVDLLVLNVILAGFEGVIGVIQTNSPQGTEVTVAQTQANIQTLAPSYQHQVFTPPAKQFTKHYQEITKGTKFAG